MANGSIVDYLNSTGKDSSFQARSQLAKNSGIENFTGTAQQNTQLLNQLQSGTPIQKGTISAPGVENASTLNIPPAPAPEIANNIISSTAIPVEQPPVTATPEQTGFQSDAQNILSELKSKQGIFQELGLGGITDTFEELLKKGQFTADAEKAAGISKKTVALNEIESQLRETDLKFRREREAIQNSAGSAASKSAEIADVSRKQASELADLSVISATRRDDLATAQTLVDRKVELTFEPIQQKLEYQKFLFEENKGLFNQVEQRMFDERVRKEEAELADKKEKAKVFANTQLAAMSNASLSGASNEILKDMQSTTNMDELVSKYGRYLSSPKEKMELQKLGIDIKKGQADYAKTIQELSAAQTQIGGTTGDPVADIITASSRYGDKRLTDSQLEKLQKAESALGSLESLQGLLSSGKDGVKLTGPVTGRTRTLLSQLGGDADARAINATIQGLIPTVARGIFGEVGVLTNADIENYKQTVPNINSTEDQNKLVSIIMYDVLSRSINSTLTSNARNQANVSNFLPLYNDSKQRVQSLKAELGVIENLPVSDEGDAFLSTQISGGLVNSINQSVGSYASQFNKK